MTGRVSLVGAGPGDPELLTLKAVERLEEADLVLYDALLDPETLRNLRRTPGGSSSANAPAAPAIRQDAINRLMIREARRGQRIVRLKCGDPFVFGRGGEEALALAAAGIPCEVVPGISSAIAAPLLAGIPVTHRGLASAFVVVSGHAESAYGPGASIAGAGKRHARRADGTREPRRHRQRRCVDGGLVSADARGGDDRRLSSRTRRAWHGTLDGLDASDLVERRENLPGIIVVGAVAALAGIISAQEAARSPRGPPPAVRVAGVSIMAVIDDPRTYGRTRLSFADTADIDEFVADARSVRARRDLAGGVAEIPVAARHLRAAAGLRCADAAGQDPAGHSRRRPARGARGRRRSPFARVRSHLDPPEHAVPLRAAARCRAGDAAPRRRRADDARSVRQLGAEHHGVPACGRGARRSVRRDARTPRR